MREIIKVGAFNKSVVSAPPDNPIFSIIDRIAPFKLYELVVVSEKPTFSLYITSLKVCKYNNSIFFNPRRYYVLHI